MRPAVEHEVDQLLLEQGEYVPLELLLSTGRLTYPDYEAWRGGELALLDEAVFGNVEQVLQELAQAEDYLQRRGWQAEPVHYRSWGQGTAGPGARPLKFSTTAALDERFHRRYRRPQDQPQLDLFTDAPGTSLHNGILEALEQRDAAEARRLLERLYDVAPDHPRLGELERLIEALEDLDQPVADAGAELARLEETVTPLADGLLGPASRHLLVPLWRRLSSALQDRPYDPARPRLHASYAAARALDWSQVRGAVEGEVGWQREPLLLERHALACEHQQALADALPAWFRLCWHFPEHAAALESSSNRTVTELWLAFQDLETALPVSSFPAWLLVQRRALTKVLPAPADPDCPDSYRTLYLLQSRSAAPGPDADSLALRAQLKDQDPDLLTAYISALNART